MRIYVCALYMLDLKGLLALWRETLALRKSIENNRGWINHPFSIPIIRCANPSIFIENYLVEILKEGQRRSINFKADKIRSTEIVCKNIISVDYMQQEILALHKKISLRDNARYEKIKHLLCLRDFPLSDVFIKDINFLYAHKLFDNTRE